MGLTKGKIVIEHTGEEIQMMLNPEEGYSFNKENVFAAQAIPGLSSPVLQFVNGNLQTLDMELFFDTTADRRDVREETGKISHLLEIDSELHAPPVLRVEWATLQFRCVLAKVTQQFTRFLETGAPVRARLSVSFSEFIDEEREAKKVNRQTADFSKVHTVSFGETLSGIAARYYEDATNWRPIAIANGIDDPRSIEAGQNLLVPPLPFGENQPLEVS